MKVEVLRNMNSGQHEVHSTPDLPDETAQEWIGKGYARPYVQPVAEKQLTDKVAEKDEEIKSLKDEVDNLKKMVVKPEKAKSYITKKTIVKKPTPSTSKNK